MRLIVNIPAFNEEEKIGDTIKRIPRSFPGVDEVRVHVIDDGSTDATVSAATRAGADAVYSHGVNRGVGKTFRTAVEHALEQQADIFVNIDADGQFDPRDIATLIAPILGHQADIVSADRFSHESAENIPWVKDRLNRLAATLIGGFMNTPIADLTCGFRAHNRESLLRLNLPGDFTYTQEVIIDALGKGLKIVWIPVKVTYFSERRSRVVRSIAQYVVSSFRIIIKAVRDVRPMKFFGVPGMALMIISGIIFVLFLVKYFGDGFKVTPYRNYLITAITAFIVGLQFFVLALMADMIKSARRLIEDQTYFMKKNHYDK